MPKEDFWYRSAAEFHARYEIFVANSRYHSGHGDDQFEFQSSGSFIRSQKQGPIESSRAGWLACQWVNKWHQSVNQWH